MQRASTRTYFRKKNATIFGTGDHLGLITITSNAGFEVPVAAVGKLGNPDLCEQALRDPERITKIILSYIMERGKHRDPSFPKALRPRQPIQCLPVFIRQKTADYMMRRKIDQVPIIDIGCMFKV